MKRAYLAFFAVVIASAAILSNPNVRAQAQSIAGQYLTNGQVLIGSTGAAPVAATLTGTAAQITVTNAAGSITFSIPAQLTVSSVTLSGSLSPAIWTKAQFDAATGVVGATRLCSDCVIPYSACVGTGTTLSGWKVTHSATVGCGTNN